MSTFLIGFAAGAGVVLLLCMGGLRIPESQLDQDGALPPPKGSTLADVLKENQHMFR